MSTLSEPSRLLPASLLTLEQQHAVDAAYEGGKLIVGDMGVGKTVVATTAITELIDDGHLSRVLIVSTPKIAKTVWRQEFAKWHHTQHINVAAATGTPQQRLADCQNRANQVVVITLDVLPWAKKAGIFELFDGLLVDETTKLTQPGGAQFKALRPALKGFMWRCGLTGTPVNENFLGLYCQMMIVDGGETFGTRFETFQNTYFYPTDYNRYNWVLQPGAEERLLSNAAPRIHIIPDYKAELPGISYENVYITMPPKLRSYYDQMRRDMVTEHAESATAAVLTQKLAQIACGFVYDDQGEAVRISGYRLDALAKLLDKLDGRPVVICYWYKEDLKALQKMLPQAEVFTPNTLEDVTERWNAGAIKVLLIHPRSAGHGLRLEQGGADLIWYQPYWSNDLDEQTNARIWRRGQKLPVAIWYLIAEDSIDQVIAARVESKDQYKKMFYNHLRGEQ